MTIEEIQQAITQLSPEELARFRAWFERFESEIDSSELTTTKMPSREFIRNLRGSLKGYRLMKAFIDQRRKEQ